MQELYKNLRLIRLRSGQSQCAVAKAVGISNAALSNYEKGYREPNLDTLIRLAEHYHVSIDSLLDRKGKFKQSVCDFNILTRQRVVIYKGDNYELSPKQQKRLVKALEHFFADCQS